MIEKVYDIGRYVYVIIYNFKGMYYKTIIGDNYTHTIIYDSSLSDEDLVDLKISN